MSNIAGKAYAMNVITPIRPLSSWINRWLFRKAQSNPGTLVGLATLSLIHYARWVVIPRKAFPHLDASQPREELHYDYMIFHSNFNGSWAQYVDSFTFAIPAGLDLFWKWNVRYPKSVPLTPFHDYIRHNQIDTCHYYSAYPMAASNDVKSAWVLKQALCAFDKVSSGKAPDEFLADYDVLLNTLQAHLGEMHPTPVVSMAAQAVKDRHSEKSETGQGFAVSNERTATLAATSAAPAPASARTSDIPEYS